MIQTQGDLTTLSAKSFELLIGGPGFGVQPLRFAVECRDPLLRTCDAIANMGSRGNGLHHLLSLLVLLTFHLGESIGCIASFLLPLPQFLLSCGNVRSRRFEHLLVGLEFRLQARELFTRLRNLCLGPR